MTDTMASLLTPDWIASVAPNGVLLLPTHPRQLRADHPQAAHSDRCRRRDARRRWLPCSSRLHQRDLVTVGAAGCRWSSPGAACCTSLRRCCSSSRWSPRPGRRAVVGDQRALGHPARVGSGRRGVRSLADGPRLFVDRARRGPRPSRSSTFSGRPRRRDGRVPHRAEVPPQAGQGAGAQRLPRRGDAAGQGEGLPRSRRTSTPSCWAGYTTSRCSRSTSSRGSTGVSRSTAPPVSGTS